MNINIYGSVSTAISYGSVTRNIVHALAQMEQYHPDSGNLLFCHNIEGNQQSYAKWEEDTVGLAIKRSQFWDTSAPCLKIFHANQLKTFINTKGRLVGFPIWETDRFSDDEWRQLVRLDGLVVASQWAKNICDEQGVSAEVPVTIAPLGVDRTLFNENIIPKDNDISRDTATKFICNGKWECRKGHNVILEAFDLAFKRTDDVVLVMNCFNQFIGQQRNDEWALYYKTGKNPEKVFVLDKFLDTQLNVANLMASCDVGLFCSRAEGWNLGLMEMMSMGKHVITTNVTAHTEFANNKNAMLVQCDKMEPANDGVFFSGQQGNWFCMEEDQIEQIAAHMRLCHELKQSGQLGVNIDGIETAKKYPWSETARKCLEALR